eukprot:g1871.t1
MKKVDRKGSSASTDVSTRVEPARRGSSRGAAVKALDEEDSVLSASDGTSTTDEHHRYPPNQVNNGFRKAYSRGNSRGAFGSPTGSKSSRSQSYRLNFDGSPGGTPSRLREMHEEKRVKEEEEKKQLEEAERARQGFSLKASKSMVLDEWPGDEGPWFSKLRYHCQFLLSLQKFDAAIGIVILINSITIGVESHYEITNQDTQFFADIEHVFLSVYVMELMARFFAFGPSCLKSGWVAFDAVLVAVGVLSTWVLPSIFSETPDELGPLLVLRVRLLVAFKTLWMLVRGLLSSAGTMCYTFVLMFLILYVSAVLAVELITKNKEAYEDDPETYEVVNKYFGGLLVTMLTLLVALFLSANLSTCMCSAAYLGIPIPCRAT